MNEDFGAVRATRTNNSESANALLYEAAALVRRAKAPGRTLEGTALVVAPAFVWSAFRTKGGKWDSIAQEYVDKGQQGILVVSDFIGSALVVPFAKFGRFAGAIIDPTRADRVQYECCPGGQCVCPCYIVDSPCPPPGVCDMTNCSPREHSPREGGATTTARPRFDRPGPMPIPPDWMNSLQVGESLRFTVRGDGGDKL